MLNHARVNVDRRYPFLNPTSLFTARATPSDSVVPPNLHRYGNRPVLLLDSTGALYLQMQRRARRQEILTGIGRLLAERADLIQTARVWRMRLLRSTRRNSSVFDVATSSIPTGEQAEEEEGEGVHTKSIVVVHEGVRRSAADVQHLIRSTGARRAAITLELKALRSQLAHLTQAKRYGEATREGCVLLLPSPVTHEVRLCSGHHYRTVCFVGEELMDIVPGDGLAPPPLSAPSSLTTTTAAAAARRSLSSEAGSRPPHHSPPTVVPPTPPLEAEDDPAQRAAQPPTPSWVNAELSGYTIFRRLRAAEEKRRRHGGRRGRAVSGDGDSSDEATATLNAYLALSACEAAMYREWGIQKYGLF
ncbi:hypothetical protein ABB37_08139 [Leptomonas pyrrhocoris]|uniref:Uncharacterized protein n=1 Tax=Leptomonas pyrrhocoris TaxID=157538 RepID=A0A0M9FU34_LEPPY|nr:hypothetical protein ABB37_08139 [Leptomonas pyrrhocoris]KPA75987.1 hypothetical protein ABB37_08139 [Leptomonas pyrrhocoris]|eukprot:XP_015654426.1 hypothetical protein ABB37_08139 [Leptomonas pyrrhocoris]